MIEEAVNQYGQKQKINNLDMIVKLEDKYLQVRLIQTEKWKNRNKLTQPMPRAKFVHPDKDERIYYMVERGHLIDLKKRKPTRKTQNTTSNSNNMN